MPDESHDIIPGGDSGAERPDVLSRAMQEGTLGVLVRAGLGPGMEILDPGCGSGGMLAEIGRAVVDVSIYMPAFPAIGRRPGN